MCMHIRAYVHGSNVHCVLQKHANIPAHLLLSQQDEVTHMEHKTGSVLLAVYYDKLVEVKRAVVKARVQIRVRI